MLNFVEAIKQIIANIQVNGGALIEHSVPSSLLLQRLREYAVQRLSLKDDYDNYTLIEWFNEGLFDEYVRVCNIYLCKLGMTDEDNVFRLISQVIDISVSDESKINRRPQSFDEGLIFSLIEVWEQLGDEQTLTYTFAKDRWLISWDYQKSCWKITGLGRLFLELSPVQAVIFLLSIDSLFSTSRYDFRHINSDLLREEFRPQPGAEYIPQLMPPHQDILFKLGVVKGRDENYAEKVRLTSLGKVVIDRTLSKDNPLRDAAKSLIESEELGDTYKGVSFEIKDVLEVINNNYLVDDANRNSITTSIQLYQDGKYQDSLRVVYPSIEAIVNTMLIKASEQPERFSGLARKLQWLEQQQLIPTDISSAVEIFTGRNRVLHGNFTPPDDYVFPLCLLAFRYLRRLLTEYRPSISTEVAAG